MAKTTEAAALEPEVVPAHVDPVAPDPAPPHVPETPASEPPADAAPRTDAATPPPPARPEAPRSGGFLPMVLGGALAAATGFGVSQYLNRDPAFDPTPLHSRIDAVQAQVDAIPAPVDLTGIETRVARMQNSLDLAFADLRERADGADQAFGDLRQRLTQVEMRGEDGAVDRAALDAYQRELADIRTRIDAQTAQLSEATASATAQLEQARRDAETARLHAQASTALATVDAALAEGAPFAAALPALSALSDLPEALTAPAADGVATLSALQADLPDAARAALSAARESGESGEDTGGRVGSFLRSQLSLRATEAQDGSSVNAILSRIEAATRAGDLDTALAEVEALPDSAQAVLADWTEAARLRARATAAAQALSQTLTEK